MLEFLRRETETLVKAEGVEWENSRLRALEELCRVILNMNEFVYTD